MINLNTYLIIEANQKRPSGLGKIKDKSEEKEVTMVAGDIYDFGEWNRYKENVKYYKGEGNGYITDKEGHVYDVFTSQSTGDAGRIVGGSRSLYVTIKNVKGKNISFSGYSAVFSSSHGMDIIEDIKAGMYLEDYIAKHWGDLSGYDQQKDEDIIKLKDAGNPDAKTYKKEKEDNIEQKRQEFLERYIPINFPVAFKIENSALTIRSCRWLDKSHLGDKKDDEEIKQKIDKAYEETFVPIVNKLLDEKFGLHITDLNGLEFSLIGSKSTAIDIKSNKICYVHWGTCKKMKDVSDTETKIEFGPIMRLDKRRAGQNKMAELFKKASDEYLRLNKRTKTKFIEDHFPAMLMQVRGSEWYPSPYQPRASYNKQMAACKKEARQKTIEEFEKNLRDHDFSSSANSIEFLTEFVSQYITKPEKLEQAIGEPIEGETTEKKERGKNTVISKGARVKQEEKMDAWHNGTRKQNVKSCSNAKLKINYDICVDKGYTHEAELLKKEAESRGLTLESVSWKITDYIEFI